MNIEGILHLDGFPDGETVVVEAGTVLRGRAELLQPPTLDCRRVLVTLGWETQDRGNAAKALLKPPAERPGSWNSGPAGALAFEFTLPADGPVSCQGRLITLRWMLRAEGEIAFKTNPQFRREIVVLPRVWSREEKAAFEAGCWDVDKLTAGRPAPSRPAAFSPPAGRGPDEKTRDRSDDEPRRFID